jgi:hypothetical protein
LSIKVHRNLNDRTADKSQGWVITENGKTRRVESLVLCVQSVKVSARTLERIRTPKNAKTSSGASGLGRRTVGAWLTGYELPSTVGVATGETIHFNPHINDTFMIQRNGTFKPLILNSTLVLNVHFSACGSVAVVA